MRHACCVLVSTLVAATVSFTPKLARAQTSLDSVLRPYLSKYDLPAVSAAVVQSGKLVAAGAVGTRRLGTHAPVTLNDRFHIGSDTKAMTALLAAMLIEEKKLRWNSTVAEVFPELAGTMDSQFRSITVEQLLSHTSGIPSDDEAIGALYGQTMFQDGNLDEMRYWLVQQWCSKPPATAPGTAFAYSNLGYTIVGAVIERVAGKTWEELITERVFSPLGLKTAGLGPQSSLGKIDAPLGHTMVDGKLKAFLAGPNGDNSSTIGPAGIAHMSVLDFARWAGWNAGEGKRGPSLVGRETLRKLHTPVITMPPKKDAAPGTPSTGGYAYGWGEMHADWAPYPLGYHGGSNQKNLALIWLDTKRDFAMVMMTNVGGTKANDALFSLSRELYTRFTKQ